MRFIKSINYNNNNHNYDNEQKHSNSTSFGGLMMWFGVGALPNLNLINTQTLKLINCIKKSKLSENNDDRYSSTQFDRLQNYLRTMMINTQIESLKSPNELPAPTLVSNLKQTRTA